MKQRVQTRDADCEGAVARDETRSAAIKEHARRRQVALLKRNQIWLGVSPNREMNVLRKNSSKSCSPYTVPEYISIATRVPRRGDSQGNVAAARDESNGNKRISPSARQGVRGARVSQAGLAIEML